MTELRVKVLDHGYVELIEKWGSEEAIIEAARMSVDRGFLGWGPYHTNGCTMRMAGSPKLQPAGCCVDKPGDEKLLSYLWNNEHATPFEMAGLTFEVMAPIETFRQWHRHRVPFGYNEMSARYTPLPDVNYLPTVERLMMGGGTNKQATGIAGADVLTEENAEKARAALADMYKLQEDLYQQLLRWGVPKELARLHIGVGRYSKMRVTGNLRGWLNGFLMLRSNYSKRGEHAQWEIRQFANTIGTIIAGKFPRTWELFTGWQRV